MKSPTVQQQSIKVEQFFSEIITGYTEFASSVQSVSDNLSLYTPAEISAQCSELQNKRSELSVLDEQMIAIVSLAAKELQAEPLISDYRKAFHSAVKACDILQQHLLLRKAEIISTFPTPPHKH